MDFIMLMSSTQKSTDLNSMLLHFSYIYHQMNLPFVNGAFATDVNHH